MRREKLIDPDKVAIYIRWSTDDQGEGTTLEVQLEGCRHYVLSQGWIVNEELIFVDDGWSGGSLERPALTRLRGRVQAGEIDCVVVFKLDRLSRSVIDMVNLVLEEWDGLTHVKSAREAVDTSSAMGKQFFYMLVSFAEWERSVIRERTTAGRQARAKEGYKPSSRAPYGYRHGERTGAYEIEEGEAPVVRRIFELYARGEGSKAIVNQLNGEGLRTRSGEMWNERTVLYMLSNPVYTGRSIYGRLTRNPRHAKGEGEPYWLRNEQPTVVEGSPFVPPLIAEELFALVQQMKAGRRFKSRPGECPSPRAVASPYLVTGLARCRCGHSLYARVQRKGGKLYEYYACLGKKNKGPAFCSATPIPREALDGAVEREILARYGDRLARERFKEAVSASLERESRAVDASLAQVAQRLERLEAQERQVRLDYREQRLTAAEFRALRKDLLEETQEQRARQEELLGARQRLEAGQVALRARLQAVERLDRWGELSAEQRKMLLTCFLRSLQAWREAGETGLRITAVWTS
ncbi:MAG: recombinase family protein [Bacillota bacterium]